MTGMHAAASAPTELAVVSPTAMVRPVDLGRATAAATDLLDALGVDRSQPGLAGTPARVAAMLAELLTPRPFEATTFPNDAGYDELVVVGDIRFTSLCEHHLLPFRGVAHVGYLPGERILGLSKFARLVEAVARRPQVQERLTAQIADWIRDHLAPRGVGVVVEAEHLCMSIRGIRAEGARTVTSTMYGLLRERPAARQEFLQLVRTG
ncbi:MAG TPA: GTP cyclohydrolase I FolE [Egicoccus sp.]|nr:GTP cyclohydrolase I FolE [Egicoccus sp.]HSK24991.1 GTP cyclohydrolase I FolE [Egicoccus sp.]